MNTQSYDIPTATAGPGVTRASVRVSYGFPDLAGQAVAFDLSNSTSPCYQEVIDLASGANTIPRLASAGAVIIIPPTDNSISITLKGVSGDTGIAIHKTAPTLLPLASSVTSFVLTATGSAVPRVTLAWI